ncbi:MAG: phage portal protein [Thermodesulfobacteriota bacterium]
MIAKLLDRAITAFSPEWGARRARARMVMGYLGADPYTGGSMTDSAMRGFHPGIGSGDHDTLANLDMLRRRSRDLVRNSAVGAGAIGGVTTAVVGEGIVPHPRLDSAYLGWDDKRAEAWEAQVAREYALWAETSACDARGVQTMAGLQALAFRSVMESGDAFALLPVRESSECPYSLRIKLIEADQVCNPDERADDDKIAGGVEVDANDQVAAYHILKRHPGGLGPLAGVREWQRVQARGSESGRRNILHLYEPTRPGQRRGVPYLAPVIKALKQLERYSEAELFAAVISAMFTVFVKRSASGTSPLDLPLNPDAEQSSVPIDSKRELRLGKGAIVELDDGEDIQIANPSRPNAQFDPFFLSVMQQIGMALQIPMEVLLKVFRNSYSASRAALQEAWRFYDTRIAWLVACFCRPVYQEWMAEAVARGRVYAPGFFKDPVARMVYSEAEWVGPTEYTLDPTKEVRAAAEAVEAGFSTREREARRLTGTSFARNHAQRVKEERMRREGGLTDTPAATRPAPKPPDPDEKTDDEESA